MALNPATILVSWTLVKINRWHLTSQPLEITHGRWAAEPNRVKLANDESRWHNSWAGLPPQRKSLDSALGAVSSYGLAFVGFLREPKGRLSMAEFEISAPGR